MDRRRLAIIFLVVFVDVFGFGVILPLMPFYAETFGASPLVIGLLGSSYALASMVASPLLGRLSDRYGRRPVLLASIFGTLLGFLMLAFARSLAMLFAARIIDGLTAGNFSVAQSYISDVTDRKNRARGLGLTGAAFGLGFIIGPTVGGLLAPYGYALPAFIAAGLAALNMVLVGFALPESLSRERRAELAAQPRGGVTLRKLLDALREPRFGPALILRSGFWLSFAIFQGVFSLWAITQLDATPRTVGLMLGYVGLMSVLTQAVLIGPLTKRFAEGRLAVVGLAVAGVLFFLWGFVPSLPITLVLLTPLPIAIGIENTVGSSLLSKSVEPWEIGGAFGLAAALQSAGTAIAPALGGALLEKVGTWAPGVLAGMLALGLVPYINAKFGRMAPDTGDERPPGEVTLEGS